MIRLIRTAAKLLLVALLTTSLSACMIVRYVDNDDENDDNGENATVNTVDPAVVDMLVFVELTRGSAAMMHEYAAFLGSVEAVLAQQNVAVRNLAIAPLYRQQSHRPALIYGRDSEDNYDDDLDVTLDYYVSEEGLARFDGTAESPAENPASLGMNLDSEAIYNPEQGSADGRAYFQAPKDGFAAFHLTGTERPCGHGDDQCAPNGSPPANYFTEATGEFADWLALPGGGLAPDDIIHVSIATAEGVDYQAFHEHCSSLQNFPSAYLDFLEPSEHHIYYDPFVDQLAEQGGRGHSVDLCEAFSAGGQFRVIAVADAIANTAR